MTPFSSFARTKVTYPSSASGSSSIRSNILLAPAIPITTALTCWETWLIFPANCLVIFKNGTTMLMANGSPEMLTFGTFNIKNNPPASVTATYNRFPILFKIGPSVLAYLLALSDTSNSSSFKASKSALLSSSWQKTFTTFCPFIISSIYPSTLPIDSCWRIKYFAELPPTFLMTRSIMITPTTTTSDIQRL